MVMDLKVWGGGRNVRLDHTVFTDLNPQSQDFIFSMEACSVTNGVENLNG